MAEIGAVSSGISSKVPHESPKLRAVWKMGFSRADCGRCVSEGLLRDQLCERGAYLLPRGPAIEAKKHPPISQNLERTRGDKDIESDPPGVESRVSVASS